MIISSTNCLKISEDFATENFQPNNLSIASIIASIATMSFESEHLQDVMPVMP